jgi:hypothetical protein
MLLLYSDVTYYPVVITRGNQKSPNETEVSSWKKSFVNGECSTTTFDYRRLYIPYTYDYVCWIYPNYIVRRSRFLINQQVVRYDISQAIHLLCANYIQLSYDVIRFIYVWTYLQIIDVLFSLNMYISPDSSGLHGPLFGWYKPSPSWKLSQASHSLGGP